MNITKDNWKNLPTKRLLSWKNKYAYKSNGIWLDDYGKDIVSLEEINKELATREHIEKDK